MAPFTGPSKEKVLALLEKSNAAKKSPITPGDMMPLALIEIDGGRWVRRRLVLNRDKARREEIHERKKCA